MPTHNVQRNNSLHSARPNTAIKTKPTQVGTIVRELSMYREWALDAVYASLSPKDRPRKFFSEGYQVSALIDTLRLSSDLTRSIARDTLTPYVTSHLCASKTPMVFYEQQAIRDAVGKLSFEEFMAILPGRLLHVPTNQFVTTMYAPIYEPVHSILSNGKHMWKLPLEKKYLDLLQLESLPRHLVKTLMGIPAPELLAGIIAETITAVDYSGPVFLSDGFGTFIGHTAGVWVSYDIRTGVRAYMNGVTVELTEIIPQMYLLRDLFRDKADTSWYTRTKEHMRGMLGENTAAMNLLNILCFKDVEQEEYIC